MREFKLKQKAFVFLAGVNFATCVVALMLRSFGHAVICAVLVGVCLFADASLND